MPWVTYNFDIINNDSDKENNSNDEKIDWTEFINKKEIKSSILYQLPDNDDYFQPTSSDFSELDGFHSDINDVDEIDY